MLMPSTCTARLMRAYTSTLYTSWYPTNTTTLYCSGLKVWWSTFGPPQTAAHAALRGLLLLRRLYHTGRNFKRARAQGVKALFVLAQSLTTRTEELRSLRKSCRNFGRSLSD